MNGFPDVNEFRKYRKICEEAGITDPLLIQLRVGGKGPAVPKGSKIKLDDGTPNPEFKLSWDEAEKAMADGFNIGHYASPDGILHLDCDLNEGSSTIPQEIIEDLIKKADTLSTKTRSGGKHLHFLSPGELFSNPHIYWNNEDAGELRTYWQYVVVPGSFVPKEKPSKAGKTKGYTPDADGYYRLINETSLKPFDFSIFPDGLTIKEAGEREITRDHNQKEPKEEHSQPLWVLNLSDEEKIKHGKRLFKNEFVRLMTGSSEGFVSPSDADFRFCSLLAKMSDSWTEIPPLLVKYRNRPEFDSNFKYKVQETAVNAWNKNDERLNLKTGRLEPINGEKGSVKKDTGTGLSFDVRTSPPPGDITPLIQIFTNEPPEDQKEKALAGLCLKNDPPVLFVRSGEIVRIIRDEHDYPSLEGLHEIALRNRLYDCVEFVTVKGTKVRPPIDCIRDIIHGREWVGRFPHIAGIVDVPLIHPDGGIVSDPGYDEQTGLYYAPSGLTIPPIPLYPTREEIRTAIKTVWEPFRQFKFVDKPDGTHVISALITIVCRNLISGNVPMLLIDKPTPGTGASLISQVLGIISEGRDPQILTAPSSEEEWKKSILSQLITGRPSIIVDNLERTLKSPSLAALLTTQEYCDRKLGTNETITLPHRLVWISNGNNCLLGGDLPRRCYWSRMDAESVRPWTDDKTFDHPDLRQWVSDNRGEILAAILTLARAWIQAGQPKPDTTVPKMGGFEQWRNVIGGILENAGIPGFLGNTQKMYELSDVEVPQWDRFVEAWYENLRERSVTTREVHNSVIMCQSFQDALPDQFIDCCEKAGTFTRMLGNALSKRKDRRYPSGYKIIHDGEIRRAVKWKVIKIESQTTFTE